LIEVSPRKRQLILNKVLQDPTRTWKGTLDNQKVRIIYTPTNPEGQKISYNVIVKRKHFSGFAGTVFDALVMVCKILTEVKYAPHN
jgi:hypothetical protein